MKNFFESIVPARRPEDGLIPTNTNRSKLGFFDDRDNSEALLRASLGLLAANSQVSTTPITAGGTIANAVTNFLDTRRALKQQKKAVSYTHLRAH